MSFTLGVKSNWLTDLLRNENLHPILSTAIKVASAMTEPLQVPLSKRHMVTTWSSFKQGDTTVSIPSGQEFFWYISRPLIRARQLGLIDLTRRALTPGHLGMSKMPLWYSPGKDNPIADVGKALIANDIMKSLIRGIVNRPLSVKFLEEGDDGYS